MSSEGGSVLLREIKNVANGKEIFLMEVSVYHNILITASIGDKRLLIWNYEFGRLMGHFNFAHEEEPTCLEFINGYSILLIGTTKSMIHVVHFKLTEDNIDFNLIGQVNLKERLSPKDQLTFENNRNQYLETKNKELEMLSTQN